MGALWDKTLQAKCPSCDKPLSVDLSGAKRVPVASPAAAGKGGGGASGSGGRALKKHSILSRINLAAFQTSTKIEVG